MGKLTSFFHPFREQESSMGKSCSEVNFTLCFDDANKDEIERLHHVISEMESENSCNRLLITKLEDELLAMQKSESRAVNYLTLLNETSIDAHCLLQKHDRDFKSDKLKVLRYKVKSVGSKLLPGFVDVVEKPRMHHSDLAVMEEELKSEYDILNNLVKVANTSKLNMEKLTEDNINLMASMERLKVDLNGE